MKNAIKLAIEGGWEAETWRHFRTRLVNPDEPIKIHIEKWEGSYIAYIGGGTWNCADIFLDPLFWQCLGKAMGWTDKIRIDYTGDQISGFNAKFVDEWNYKWHRFIDHLAEGKDVESFFTNLLKK